jgi:hypothetical protein
MALMATALPPTQMSVLPSIVDASSKTAAAPTEAGQQVPASNPGTISNGGSAPAPSLDPTNGALVKPQTNGSRQSLTTNTVLERSPSSGSQILVPSNLKSSLTKLVGDSGGAAIGGGAPSYQPPSSAAPLLSVAVVSNNGKVVQSPEVPATSAKTILRPASNLMLTFDGESSKPGHTCGASPTTTTLATTTLPTPTTATTTTTVATIVNETSMNSDAYDAEDDIMYCV